MALPIGDAKQVFITYWRQIVPALDEPVAEYRFARGRRWRFDWSWSKQKVAVEIHGGVYAQGRHTRGTGFENDRRKMNAATAMGWRVFEFSTGMLDRDPVGCIDLVVAVLKTKVVKGNRV